MTLKEKLNGQCETGGLLRMFCPHGGIVAGETTQWNLRLGGELRVRLRAFVTILVVVALIFTARRFWVPVPFNQLFTDSLTVFYVLVALLLYSRKQIPLQGLRVIEVSVFSLMTLGMIYIDYSFVVPPLLAGQPELALAEWHRSLVHAIVVIAAYAMFIPSTWLRSALIVIPISSWPFVIAALLAWLHPEEVQAARHVLTFERLSFAAIMLGVADAIAIYGAFVINRFRARAVEADTMGQYRLEDKIGEGGMGEVWRAQHQLLARPTAIKLIRPELLGNGDADTARRALGRFEREAQATAALQSPHTVQLYDYGTTLEGTFYYVMELLDGIDLDTLVKEHGPLPAERAIFLLRQVADSLADAHNRGLVHRDIKPANIFATRMGVSHDFAKVLDFGLVKYEEQTDMQSKLTVEGVTSGTPAYMPPEMALGSAEVDGRADLYSLGAVAYWMVTGHQVFEGDSAMAVVVDHIKTEPIPPSQRTEIEVPAELEGIIMRLLSKDPADRYQSALKLAEDLDACCATQPPWTSQRAEEWWSLHGPDQPESRAATTG